MTDKTLTLEAYIDRLQFLNSELVQQVEFLRLELQKRDNELGLLAAKMAKVSAK